MPLNAPSWTLVFTKPMTMYNSASANRAVNTNAPTRTETSGSPTPTPTLRVPRGGGPYVPGERGFITTPRGKRRCNLCGVAGLNPWWFGSANFRPHHDLVHLACGHGCGRYFPFEPAPRRFDPSVLVPENRSPLLLHERRRHGSVHTRYRRIERRQ